MKTPVLALVLLLFGCNRSTPAPEGKAEHKEGEEHGEEHGHEHGEEGAEEHGETDDDGTLKSFLHGGGGDVLWGNCPVFWTDQRRHYSTGRGEAQCGSPCFPG